jgi:hypothetical protein
MTEQRAMSTTKHASNQRLTDADFPKPQHISDDKLNAFFDGYGFDTGQASRMSSQLKYLVNEYSEFMTAVKDRKTRIDDLANLAASLREIEDAIYHLKACGPVGQGIARNSVYSLGKMFSVLWLCEAFPNDDDLPQPEFPTAGRRGRTPTRTPMRTEKFYIEEHTQEARAPNDDDLPQPEFPTAGRPGRTPMRTEKFYIEEHTQEARARFAQARNLLLIIAALKQFKEAIEAALLSGKKPGRDPCKYRHYFIIDLAVCWEKIGYDAASSNFLDFCKYVFEEIGWPRGGLKRAKDKALADLRSGR